MINPKPIHLNCHSEYSIIDGILRIKPLLRQIKKFEMEAVAITDQSNLFAMVKFYKAAISIGIKPIIGCDLYLQSQHAIYRPARATFLCQNTQGLNNLMILISRSYNNWHVNMPLVQLEWLIKENLHQGLIMLAPMFDSDVGQAIVNNDLTLASEIANNWYNLLGDRFYLAGSRVGKPRESEHLQQLLTIAANNIPLVATNEVRFLMAEDFIAHEARICINQGLKLEDPQRKKKYTNNQYLINSEEFNQLFADLPAALINSQEIAKRCNLKLEFGKTYLPRSQVPDGSTEEVYLQRLALEGLAKRFKCNIQDIASNYVDRINTELTVINGMGFAGYFLIVADIIQWTLQQGIAVGPGRGSGAGSLVAYALFITNINPLDYGLLFERFLNPERVSMPDFDIDFCIHGRDAVIDYVANKYGKSSVAQIITYGTMAAKAAIRDVGRVLGSPYGFVDQIAKLIPIEIGITITKALEQEPTLKSKYEEDDEVKSIIDLAIKLEGITRNVGKHAGGLVIAPKPIVNFSPLYQEANNAPAVTQFDKNDIEDLGLVKFDFLGLKTLTVINMTVQSINQKFGNKLDLNAIPLDDLATFALLSSGNTTAVFQLESRGMQELNTRLQPNCFEDLIAIGALYRPGPLQSGMVDDFINRKRGKAAIQYPHPEVAEVLKSTYGVIVYQEQVMQIAQILAGYTLGGADLLRRAMGKKKPEEMAKQRKIFIAGVENLDKSRDPKLQLGASNAENIFNLIDKFSGYGFNKSHAAAYALITYQTAWLKTHYPAEFMAAVLSLDLDHTDKVIMFIVNSRNMGITIAPPDINSGEYYFVATNSNIISYGLGAVKGVGETAIQNIIQVRQQRLFTDLWDLCSRVDLHKVSRKTLEALIKAGALDCFNLHRAALLGYLEEVLKHLNKSNKFMHNNQQLDLFGQDYNNYHKNISFDPDGFKNWSKAELLAAEQQALGFYFSEHPLESYKKQLANLRVLKFKQALISTKTQKFAGSIAAIRISRTKRNEKIAFITLDDGESRQEVLVFSDLYLSCRELLKKDQLIIIEGVVSKDFYTDGIKIRCDKILDLFACIKQTANNITIVLKPEIKDLGIFSEKIKDIIKTNPGVCPLKIHYHNFAGLTKIKLGDAWRVAPVKHILTALEELPEVAEVYMEY